MQVFFYYYFLSKLFKNSHITQFQVLQPHKNHYCFSATDRAMERCITEDITQNTVHYHTIDVQVNPSANINLESGVSSEILHHLYHYITSLSKLQSIRAPIMHSVICIFQETDRSIYMQLLVKRRRISVGSGQVPQCCSSS